VASTPLPPHLIENLRLGAARLARPFARAYMLASSQRLVPR
jgi:hypothetical protein